MSPGNGAQLLKSSGALERPELVTLHLSRTLRETSVVPPLVTSSPFVELEWGSGATTQVARVDIGNGLALTLTASSLMMGVVYPPGLGPAYTVHATLVWGSRPGNFSMGPTFTQGPLPLAGGGAPVLQPIPPFSRALVVLLSSLAPLRTGAFALVTVRFLSDLAATLAVSREFDPAHYLELSEPLQVPNWANFWEVSASGVGAVTLTGLHDLAL